MPDIDVYTPSRNRNTIDHLYNAECDSLLDLVFLLAFF